MFVVWYRNAHAYIAYTICNVFNLYRSIECVGSHTMILSEYNFANGNQAMKFYCFFSSSSHSGHEKWLTYRRKSYISNSNHFLALSQAFSWPWFGFGRVIQPFRIYSRRRKCASVERLIFRCTLMHKMIDIIGRIYFLSVQFVAVADAVALLLFSFSPTQTLISMYNVHTKLSN